MSEEVGRLLESVKGRLAEHCVGTVDRSEQEGQVAFLTDEPDTGEHVTGMWTDTIRRIIKDSGIAHASVMPFPVSGRLTYVVAGLHRSSKSE